MEKNFKKEYALFLLKNLSHLQERTGKSEVFNGLWKDCQQAISGLERLDPFTKDVIGDVFFEHKTWQEVMDKRYISHTTIARCRKKALSAVIYALESSNRAV